MKIIWILIGVMCMAFLAICIISTIENRRLIVTRYRIQSAKIPKAYDGVKLVVLADLHNACFGEGNTRLLDKIREEKPDFIIIAGDMIVADKNSDITVPVQLIQTLAEEYPIYYTKGNHELRASLEPETYGSLWNDYKTAIQNYVHFLDNETVEWKLPDVNGNIDRTAAKKLYLTGLNMDAVYYKRFRRKPMEQSYLKEALGDCQSDAYQILIAHHPAYFPAYAEWGADLVLSGHLHGGMIRLPGLGGMISPMVQFFPKYDRGRYEEDGHILLLSGGLGNHTFKFRVNNLPELVSVELTSDSNRDN